MENKIIINERIAGVFLGMLEQDPIKGVLTNSKYTISENCICNRAIINALFSILKDTLAEDLYEYFINKLVFSKYRYYQCPINRVSDEKLTIDLNLCIDNYVVVDNYNLIAKYFDQITECDEFYRIMKDELDNFYKNRKSYTPVQQEPFEYNNSANYFGFDSCNPFNQHQIAKQPMGYANNPYINQQQTGGYFESPFNKQQMQAINEICTEIPMFQPDGTPMNEAANNLVKVIDHRIEEYEKTKARNRRKAR